MSAGPRVLVCDGCRKPLYLQGFTPRALRYTARPLLWQVARDDRGKPSDECEGIDLCPTCAKGTS